MKPTTDRRYSPGFERLLDYAAYDCAQRGLRAVSVDHLLLGLFREDFPLIDDVLQSFRVDSLVVLDRLLREHPEAPKPVPADDVQLSPEALVAIELSRRQALGLGHSLLHPAHTLLGILDYNRDRLERFFIREEIFRQREEEVLARVRDLVRWLRPGDEPGAVRELGFLEPGTIVGMESLPLRNPGDRTNQGYAVRLRMFKRFSV